MSFCLIFSEILSANKKIRESVLFLMAILSEGSQLIFQNLGTFDLVDLALYFIVAIIFLAADSKSERKSI